MRPAIFYYCLAQTRAANRDRQAQHGAPIRARTTWRAVLPHRPVSNPSDPADTTSNPPTGNRTP
jgi:hypothetical protein